MNVASLNQTIQASLASLVIQLEYLFNVAQKAISQSASQFDCNLIEFTPLQWTLVKVLLALLIGTSCLIWYSWHCFGTVITEKFVRPSTLKEIEELKLSVAKLKLPKEHSPRI